MLRLELSLFALASVVFALPASAQCGGCSDLSITSETVGTTTNYTVAVTGSLPNTIAWAAVGDTAGETVFDLGQLGSVTLCLAQPFVIAPIGFTDANGDVSLAFAVPASDPLGIDLATQAAAFTIGFDFSVIPPALTLDSCISNTATISL